MAMAPQAAAPNTSITLRDVLVARPDRWLTSIVSLTAAVQRCDGKPWAIVFGRHSPEIEREIATRSRHVPLRTRVDDFLLPTTVVSPVTFDWLRDVTITEVNRPNLYFDGISHDGKALMLSFPIAEVIEPDPGLVLKALARHFGAPVTFELRPQSWLGAMSQQTHRAATNDERVALQQKLARLREGGWFRSLTPAKTERNSL